MDEESPLGPRSRKVKVALLVLAIHLGLGLALLNAFASGAMTTAARVVLSTFNVAPPPDAPPPPPPPSGDDGDKGEAGKKAVVRDAELPKTRIPRESKKRSGDADTSGTTTQGGGPGSSIEGDGPGAAGGGGGPGCTPRPRPVHISGSINSIRDFPSATLEQRDGQSVTVAFTVGIDGRARSCRINRASPDPESDRIVCRLVEERFRFEPALNARCEPVAMIYGWNQRWFDPRN